MCDFRKNDLFDPRRMNLVQRSNVGEGKTQPQLIKHETVAGGFALTDVWTGRRHICDMNVTGCEGEGWPWFASPRANNILLLLTLPAALLAFSLLQLFALFQKFRLILRHALNLRRLVDIRGHGALWICFDRILCTARCASF